MKQPNRYYYDQKTGQFSKDKPAVSADMVGVPTMVMNFGDMAKEADGEDLDKAELLSKLSNMTEVLAMALNKLCDEQAKTAAAMYELCDQQAKTAMAMNEMCEAYKSPKKIIRDANGRPEGIE